MQGLMKTVVRNLEKNSSYLKKKIVGIAVNEDEHPSGMIGNEEENYITRE